MREPVHLQVFDKKRRLVAGLHLAGEPEQPVFGLLWRVGSLRLAAPQHRIHIVGEDLPTLLFQRGILINLDGWPDRCA